MKHLVATIVSSLVLSTVALGACPTDVNDDGATDIDDVIAVILAWGTSDPDADVDASGVVDVDDVVAVILAWGPCPPEIGAASVGVFDASTNYFELRLDDGSPLEFHFGSQMSGWGVGSRAVSGDFDGDGADTVVIVDHSAQSFLLADENDSDEYEDRGTTVVLTNVPPVPPGGDGPPTQLAVAGDWNGDGVDGVGFYNVGENTFYLRDALTSGPPTHVVFLDPAAGFPEDAYALAGDFDGDGDDEVGLHLAGVAYLADDLSTAALAASFAIPGAVAIAGDFDGDGTDTIATYENATSTFTILDANTAGAGTSTVPFGHAEPGFWSWAPLAGRWQVPATPVASRGFEWTTGAPAANGVNGEAFAAAINAADAAVPNLQALLVARNGQLIGERYLHGYDRQIGQNVKSVSKSVLSGIYGVAYDQGEIAGLADTVATYLPTYFQGLGEGKQSIRIIDMMTMRGGLFAGPSTTEYNLGLRQSPDYTEYVLEQALVSTPGTTYVYSTGLTHLGSAMLTEAVGVSTREYARQHLFGPIGISAPRWDGSPEGYDFGGAEMWLRPRDLARFGQLFLENGTLDDQLVLSPLWVTESANPWVPESGGRLYGLWWRERPWTNYPFTDSYFAWGYGGQFLFLFPTWDLLVVTNAKWNVDNQVSGQVASQIFTYVDQQILPTMGD